MLTRGVSKLLIFLGIIIIVASFYFWQHLWLKDFNENDAIAKGISIAGHDVSGYDTESAMHMLSIQLKNELSSKNIEIIYNDIKTTFNVASFASLDFKSSLDEAYALGRSGDKTQDYKDLLSAKISGLSLNAKITFDDQALEALLKEASTSYNIAAKDASIATFNPDAAGETMLTINPQEDGRELSIEKTAQSIKDAVVHGESSAHATIDITYAKITDDVLQGLTLNPIISEFVVSSASAEFGSAISQVIGNGRHQILLPGDELSIIEFMGTRDYIATQMTDNSSGTDYENAVAHLYPTQIYIAAILSELQVVTRKMYNLEEDRLPTGTSTITDKTSDLVIKNTLDYPIIIRVGYDYKSTSGIAYCEIYRTQMEYKTYIKSVIRKKDDKSFVDIVRVYADNKGNTQDSVIAETIEID